MSRPPWSAQVNVRPAMLRPRGLPGQGQQLAAAQAGRQVDGNDRVKQVALELTQHRLHLVGAQDLDLLGLDRRRRNDGSNVAIDELVLERLLQCSMQDTMGMTN